MKVTMTGEKLYFVLQISLSLVFGEIRILRVSEIFVRISRLLVVLLSSRSKFVSLLLNGRLSLLLSLFVTCVSHHFRKASLRNYGWSPDEGLVNCGICFTWISGILRICYHACDMFVYKSKEKEENNTKRYVCCLSSSTWKKYG